MSILQLATGTAVSQAIVLLTTPLLTRYYSPHDFGVAGFFLSFLLFLGPLSSLNYYQAIILPRHEAESLRLGRICLWISLAFCPLMLGASFLLRSSLGSVFKMPELADVFWLFPAAILLRSIYLVLASFMSRYRAFSVQSTSRVCQTVSERFLLLAAGMLGQASSVLMVLSRLVSSVIETAVLLLAFLRRPKTQEAGSAAPKTHRELALEYRDFPIYSSWSMLLANGSSQLPLILLPMLFVPAVGGFFALGNRLFQLPMQLFGESIRNAYYKELTDRMHQGADNGEGFASLRGHLVAAGMFPFIFLLFFGRYLFGAIFGMEWAEAGSYAGILGFYYFFQFTSSPIVCIFNAYKKQNYLMLISALLFVNNLVSLLAGAYLSSPTKGFVLMSVNGIAIYLFMNFLAERTLRSSHKAQFSTYGRYLAYNLPFILFFFLLKQRTQDPLWITAMVAACAVCYYLLVYQHKVATFFLGKGTS